MKKKKQSKKVSNHIGGKKSSLLKERRSNSTRENKSDLKGSQPLAKYSSIGRVLKLVVLMLFIYVGFNVAFNFASLVEVGRNLKFTDVVAEDSNVRWIDTRGISKTLFVFGGTNSAGDEEISAAYLLIYNEINSNLTVVYIPGWVYISPANSEITEVISINNLQYAGGILSDGDRDYEYAIWELLNITAISPDSYVWIESDSVKVWEELAYGDESINLTDGAGYLSDMFSAVSVYKLLYNHEDLNAFAAGIKSNITAVDLYQDISKYNEFLKSGDAKIIDLSKDEYLIREASADRNDKYFYNLFAVDSELESNFASIVGRDIEREQTRVEIYNGSSISGLAFQYTRRISNNGLNVIRSDNSPVAYEKTVIYVSDRERFANSLALIVGIMPISVEVIEGRPDFMTTADIVIVLGQDYGVVYNW